jgi:hypothetical protein
VLRFYFGGTVSSYSIEVLGQTDGLLKPIDMKSPGPAPKIKKVQRIERRGA